LIDVAAFHQVKIPIDSVAGTTLLALVPVAVLLVALAVFRITAWVAVIIGSIVTIILGLTVWGAPFGDTMTAYLWGALTGVWAVDWIVFWGVIIYFTLVETGLFDRFKMWVIQQATADIRVQTLLLAWAFGALLEGLVGFGYPWAIVAPILIALGVSELDSIRVAALANNAPVSYGALGAPILGLAAVTGLGVTELGASIGRIVAILALFPPWILIYLVTGWRGLKDGWPLAVVGSFAYIAGQFPVSQFNPYLPDIIGALVCFAALLVLLKFWRPKVTLGYGGVPVEELDTQVGDEVTAARQGPKMSASEALRAIFPFLILVVIVIAWTGPWSSLTDVVWFAGVTNAISSLSHQPVPAEFDFKPWIAGTAILVSWIAICLFVRPSGAQLGAAFRRTFQQTWGALLVGFFIFGLAYVFNFSGMAASLAFGFSKVGTAFIVLAPILGWIGVALSGSNTSTNALFGQFQYSVGKLLGFPIFILPSLNSVGAEVGKPVAPQTASVGVSTTEYVRNEGAVIRHNMGWTLILLLYLIGIGLLYYFVLPAAMT
jgi:lactate permease